MGLAACVLCLAGCGGGPTLGRLSEPVPLPNGAPQNTCEREEWYELVPSRVVGEGATPTFSRYQSQQITTHLYEGYGIYRPGESDPEDLEDVWPRMNEPALQKQHVVIIDQVDSAMWKSAMWGLGGLAVMAAGVGTAAAVQEDSPTLATTAGITGVALGVTGAIVMLATFPPAGLQAAAEAREKIFVPGEDDMEAVQRGTDRANAQRRRHCGGTPAAPYKSPYAGPKPAAVNEQ